MELELAADAALLRREQANAHQAAMRFLLESAVALVPNPLALYDDYQYARLERAHLKAKMRLDLYNQQLQLLMNVLAVRQELGPLAPLAKKGKKKWWRKLICG
jgi:hypothetical protein